MDITRSTMMELPKVKLFLDSVERNSSSSEYPIPVDYFILITSFHKSIQFMTAKLFFKRYRRI